jgi:hypothetical protein
MTARRVQWAPIVAAAALAAAAVAFVGAPTPLRAPVALVFLALGPGMAFVPLLGLRDPVAELTVGVGVSFALDLAVAAPMRYAGAWSPGAILAVLCGLALAGAALQRRKAGGRRT